MNRPLPTEYFASGVAGFSAAIAADPRRVTARKREVPVEVYFAREACEIATPEGNVLASAGDAVLTNNSGERWPVTGARFPTRYRPVPPTGAGSPGRYVSVPNEVIALRLPDAFEVVLSDGVSRLHGVAGDWLVDYGDGSLGVVGAAAFSNTYEIIG